MSTTFRVELWYGVCTSQNMAFVKGEDIPCCGKEDYEIMLSLNKLGLPLNTEVATLGVSCPTENNVPWTLDTEKVELGHDFIIGYKLCEMEDEGSYKVPSDMLTIKNYKDMDDVLGQVFNEKFESSMHVVLISY